MRDLSEMTTSPQLLYWIIITDGKKDILFALSATGCLMIWTMGLTHFGKKKKKLYIPVSAKNWNLYPLSFIFSCIVLLFRNAIFHSLHLQKSHSLFWGQFCTYSLHGSKTLTSQHLTHISLVANNSNIMSRIHAVWSETATSP